MSEKRVIPVPLQHILKQDVFLTNLFCKACEKFLPPDKYRKYYKILEISCHGVPWLVTWLAFLWILWNPNYFEAQVNFLFGLLLDMLLVSLVKAATRRRRPPANKQDMFLTLGSDCYSFPSGHISRAVFITLFFTRLCPAPPLIRLFFYLWATVVSLSRILLKRHFILDALGGLALGWLELAIAYVFWLGQPTAQWLVTFISEENVSLEGLKDDDQ